MEKQETIRRLFTSEPYVKSEYQYHRITNKGNVDEQQLHENWTSYLEEYQVLSTKYNNTLFDNSFMHLSLYAWHDLQQIFVFQFFIEKGFQFTRLAVQEPYGVMVLKVNIMTSLLV